MGNSLAADAKWYQTNSAALIKRKAKIDSAIQQTLISEERCFEIVGQKKQCDPLLQYLVDTGAAKDVKGLRILNAQLRDINLLKHFTGLEILWLCGNLIDLSDTAKVAAVLGELRLESLSMNAEALVHTVRALALSGVAAKETIAHLGFTGWNDGSQFALPPELIDSLRSFPLTSLSVNGLAIDDSFLSKISELAELIVVYLRLNNNVTLPGLGKVAALPKLVILDVSGSSLAIGDSDIRSLPLASSHGHIVLH